MENKLKVQSESRSPESEKKPQVFWPKPPNFILYLLLLVFQGATIVVLVAVLINFDGTIWEGIGFSSVLLVQLLVTFYVIFSVKNLVYIVTEEALFISEKLFVNKEIPVAKIRKIKQVTSILNTPTATTYKRLELFYNVHDSIMISPEEEQRFIDTLIALNSDIKAEIKENKLH